MKWTFAINKEFYPELKKLDTIKWNSAKEVRKGDIILVYTGQPYSSIGFILKAISGPFEDPEIRKKWNRPAVNVEKIAEISKPIELSELKENPVLSNWGAVKFNFRRSHFKMSNMEWEEIKKLIIEKNPELKDKMDEIISINQGKIEESNYSKEDFSIKTFLETVFNEYYDARINKEPVKGHKLSKLFSNKFTNYIEGIANDPSITIHEHDYQAYSKFQGKGSWFKTPWALLYDKKMQEKIDTSRTFYINYVFSEDMSKAYVSLSIGWSNYGDINSEILSKWTDQEKRQALRDQATKLRNKIISYIPDDFSYHFKDSPWQPTTICGKYYEKDSIPEEEILKADLVKLIKIYNKLIEIGIDYIEPKEVINALFNDFREYYLELNQGREHLTAYSETSTRFKNNLDKIKIKKSRNEDVTDDILYGLVPHKGENIVGFMSDIKAYFEKKLKIDPETFPEIAETLYNLIINLDKYDEDPLKQKELFSEFENSEYSKGIGVGNLSASLFFINNKYPLINSKTIQTVKFLSELTEKTVKMNKNLSGYVETKENLEKFLSSLSAIVPEFSNFAVFDIFCHWMCDKNLANYAIDQDKYREWLKKNFGNVVVGPSIDKPELVLYPKEIKTTLKLNQRVIYQICGTLNADKHIMMTGAPGTGKTDLVESVCDIASSLGYTEGYILTTATSDWTTFDTIGGYMPDKNGKLYFEEGKFLQSIRENKWLIIDEINRADIDKAFGQLFTVLSGQGVELPYKNNGKSIKIKPGTKNDSYYSPEDSTYYVGKNWRILATMNVYDKDYLFEMSYAFMRRFTFIYIDLPDENDFKELINEWCGDLDSHYIESINKLLKINEYRQIGPAIFKDIAEYVKEREKIGSNDLVLNDAVLSYIIPQFEGLERVKVMGIWNIIKEIFDYNEEIKMRLEDIATVKLDESE
ncbi:MAG: hypothetical protein Kow0019_08940 [Methanobacteriaceae archaeon]